MTLPEEDRRALRRQLAVDRLVSPLMLLGGVFYLRVFRHYRFEGLAASRRLYREALARRRPTVVCANHLTLSDSVLLHYALSSPLAMLLDFRRLSWNVPERLNFKTTWPLRLVTYLLKCLPIERAGSREHKDRVLASLRWLLAEGEVVTIFPEGTRSRSGRFDVDNLSYGVGDILRELPEAQVVCVYVRARGQEGHSRIPPPGDTIEVTAALVEPRTEAAGMRAARDLTRQIGACIKQLEEAWFERPRRPDSARRGTG